MVMQLVLQAAGNTTFRGARALVIQGRVRRPPDCSQLELGVPCSGVLRAVLRSSTSGAARYPRPFFNWFRIVASLSNHPASAQAPKASAAAGTHPAQRVGLTCTKEANNSAAAAVAAAACWLQEWGNVSDDGGPNLAGLASPIS
jgi:hypothetical protein